MAAFAVSLGPVSGTCQMYLPDPKTADLRHAPLFGADRLLKPFLLSLVFDKPPHVFYAFALPP